MKHTIAPLLDKYFSGATTLEEEATLCAYFDSDDLLPEHRALQPMFRFCAEQKGQSAHADFDGRLLPQLEETPTGDRMQQLWDRYFSEESLNDAERTELQMHFLSGTVREDWKPYADLFFYAESLRDERLGNDFDERFFAALDGREVVESRPEKELRAYFDAKTSLEQESDLRNRPGTLGVGAAFDALFAYQRAAREETVSEDFEARLFDRIDEGVVPEGNVIPMRPRRERRYLWAAAAAVVLLIGSFAVFSNLNNTQTDALASAETDLWEKYEVTDAEAAAEETEEALRLLAKAFGSSTKKATQDLKKIERATDVLN